MKLLRLIKISLIFIVLSTLSEARGNGNMSSIHDIALVYYFDFDIQRVTGIPEEGEYGIERYSQYQMNREDFNNSILYEDKLLDAKIPYDSSDVRAKVIFNKFEYYFIDNKGYFKGVGSYGKVDKKIFSNSLKILKS